MIVIKDIDIDSCFETISKWWKFYNKVGINKMMLPGNGNSGLSAFVDDKLVASVFIFETNSPIWYCDLLCADPNYKENNRQEVLTALIDKAVINCFKKEALSVWCTTPYDSVLSKLKDLDYNVEDKKHYIIWKTKK